MDAQNQNETPVVPERPESFSRLGGGVGFSTFDLEEAQRAVFDSNDEDSEEAEETDSPTRH